MVTNEYVLDADEAHLRARSAAAGLAALGVTAGHRVAICAPSQTGATAAIQAGVATLAYGALCSHIVPVMINPLLSPIEQQQYLRDAKVTVTLDDADVLRLTTPAPKATPPVWEDQPHGRPMHFTSGTTGRSKGVWAPDLTTEESAQYWQDEHLAWPIAADDVVLNFGPLAHSAPLRFAFLAFASGARIIFTGGFDVNRTAAAIARWSPTVAMAVPTHLQRLFALPGGAPPSTFRLLAHAGSACPPDLKQRIHQWAGAEHVWEFLGSTEGQFTLCSGLEWQERPGTLGRARPGRTLVIDDGSHSTPGTIWCDVADFARFEYFGDHEKTSRAWRTTATGRAFTVGDLGEIDQDGYLFLKGRRTDLIVTGGVNVYPAEVEAELRHCPGIDDAAVFGEPDRQWGERVCAAVVTERPLADIAQWCALNLAPYRRPKRIAVVAELPLTSNGKVRRSDLSAWVAQHGKTL